MGMDFPPNFVEIFFRFIYQAGMIMFRKGLISIWFYMDSMLIRVKTSAHILILHRYMYQYQFDDQSSLRQDSWHSTMVATVSCFACGAERLGMSTDVLASGDILARPN